MTIFVPISIIGNGAGAKVGLLPPERHFPILLNSDKVFALRPFTQFDNKDGTTITGTAIYSDASLGSFLICDDTIENLHAYLNGPPVASKIPLTALQEIPLPA